MYRVMYLACSQAEAGQQPARASSLLGGRCAATGLAWQPRRHVRAEQHHCLQRRRSASVSQKLPQDGFDTVIDTFGLCSHASPVEALKVNRDAVKCKTHFVQVKCRSLC